MVREAGGSRRWRSRGRGAAGRRCISDQPVLALAPASRRARAVADEGVGAGVIEAEIAGEAEVGEGVPVVRAACCCGEGRILGEEFADGGFVGEDGGGVDVGGGDVRVAGEDEVGVLERAGGMPAVAGDDGDFDEGVTGSGRSATERMMRRVSRWAANMGQEAKPCSRARTSCASARVMARRFLGIVEAGVVAADAVEGGGLARDAARARSLACFLYCSRLGRSGSSRSGIRSSFQSVRLGVRMGQAERRFVRIVEAKVGTALSADWMRPSRFPQSKGWGQGESRDR